MNKIRKAFEPAYDVFYNIQINYTIVFDYISKLKNAALFLRINPVLSVFLGGVKTQNSSRLTVVLYNYIRQVLC